LKKALLLKQITTLEKYLKVVVIDIRPAKQIPTEWKTGQVLGIFPASKSIQKPLYVGRGKDCEIKFHPLNQYVSEKHQFKL
jgi:hypothetical protein